MQKHEYFCMKSNGFKVMVVEVYSIQNVSLSLDIVFNQKCNFSLVNLSSQLKFIL